MQLVSNISENVSVGIIKGLYYFGDRVALSRTLDTNSILTGLIARGDFSKFVGHKNIT
jgi:hypothetical protein